MKLTNCSFVSWLTFLLVVTKSCTFVTFRLESRAFWLVTLDLQPRIEIMFNAFYSPVEGDGSDDEEHPIDNHE